MGDEYDAAPCTVIILYASRYPGAGNDRGTIATGICKNDGADGLDRWKLILDDGCLGRRWYVQFNYIRQECLYFIYVRRIYKPPMLAFIRTDAN